MTMLIVDGYNMIRRVARFKKAENSSLREGRERLLLELEDYGAKIGFDILVVFDGSGRPHDYNLQERERFAGIDIMFSKKGESADMAIIREIRRIKKDKESVPIDIILVSNDIAIRNDAVELGANTMSIEFLDTAIKN